MSDIPHLNDACPSGDHEIGRDSNGMQRCTDCGLTLQTLVDSLGHDTR
jgi:hypothetical protein